MPGPEYEVFVNKQRTNVIIRILNFYNFSGGHHVIGAVCNLDYLLPWEARVALWQPRIDAGLLSWIVVTDTGTELIPMLCTQPPSTLPGFYENHSGIKEILVVKPHE